MSLNKLIIIFGIILTIFAAVVFFQFSSRAERSTRENTATVKVKNRTFHVDVADTSEKQQKGLSGKDKFSDDKGMLFIFETKSYHYFWMKDMKFPLDIIFINDNKIVSIAKNVPKPNKGETNLPLYKSRTPVNKVLEINAGLSDKYGIKEGDTVEITLPSKQSEE